jgi:hypothetical protein
MHIILEHQIQQEWRNLKLQIWQAKQLAIQECNQLEVL